MNLSDFTYLLCHPNAITSAQTQELEVVLKEFPYLQSARAIYLKGLYNQNNYKYNSELKISAAYTTDRTILFNFITSKIFKSISSTDLKKIEALKEILITDIEVVSQQKNNLPTQTSSLEESIIKSIIQADKTTFEPVKTESQANLDVFNENIEVLKQNEAIEPTSFSTDENHKKLIDFNPDESLSFSQWLKLTKMQPIEREPNILNAENILQEQEAINDRENKFKIIDKFIQTNPKIIPVKNATITPINIEKSTEEKSYLMTETLAKIYLEQKKYQKAIQAYEILILKYPEKSSLFAERIQEIKNFQNNNN